MFKKKKASKIKFKKIELKNEKKTKKHAYLISILHIRVIFFSQSIKKLTKVEVVLCYLYD
jgi:hypothetical protein